MFLETLTNKVIKILRKVKENERKENAKAK